MVLYLAEKHSNIFQRKDELSKSRASFFFVFAIIWNRVGETVLLHYFYQQIWCMTVRYSFFPRGIPW